MGQCVYGGWGVGAKPVRKGKERSVRGLSFHLSQSSFSWKECRGPEFPSPLRIPQLSLDLFWSPPSFPQAETESVWVGGGAETRDGGAGVEGLGA